AAGDHRLDARRKNAAGNQREFIRLPLRNDGVPGIGAALVADNDVVLLSQQIDELALGFVAPLQTNDTSSGHNRPQKSTGKSVWRSDETQGSAKLVIKDGRRARVKDGVLPRPA